MFIENNISNQVSIQPIFAILQICPSSGLPCDCGAATTVEPGAEVATDSDDKLVIGGAAVSAKPTTEPIFPSELKTRISKPLEIPGPQASWFRCSSPCSTYNYLHLYHQRFLRGSLLAVLAKSFLPAFNFFFASLPQALPKRLFACLLAKFFLLSSIEGNSTHYHRTAVASFWLLPALSFHTIACMHLSMYSISSQPLSPAHL